MQVRITNKMSEKINEFQEINGATRTWIANKAGMSRQTLNSLEKSDNPTIQSLERIAFALKCKVTELYECKIIKD